MANQELKIKDKKKANFKFVIRNFSFVIIFILITVIGFFGVAGKVSATCSNPTFITQEACESGTPPNGTWTADTPPAETAGCYFTSPETGQASLVGTDYNNCVAPNHWVGKVPTPETPKSDFETTISQNACSFIIGSGTFWPGCFIQASYGFFYVIPAFLLSLSAYFFNVLISITLYSNLFAGSAFISEAWGVVRDLSNIFFILILLYIAIKIILDLGEHEAKKMIAKVIIIALLINFSMFFTQIIIDSSNVLALIFYNKMSVETTVVGQTEPRDYDTITGEKDVAGGLTNAFNPTSLLTKEFFEKAKIQSIPGYSPIKSSKVPPGILIGITIIAGLLMGFAAYAFFIAGISFIGRMIELFVLIIFSPFAFMSFAIPQLSNFEYLGWNAWLKRLLKTSFMAPIFMFFLYFIFMLVHKKIFDGLIKSTNQSMIETILLIVIPALVILILLLQATKFAKKGSGEIGEMVFKGAQIAGGLALGAATGGTSLLATGAIGGLASKVAGSETLKGWATTKSGEDRKGLAGWLARKTLKTADYGTKATFDVRNTGAGKALAKSSGINLQSTKVFGLGSREGGFKGMQERKAEALKKEKEIYKTTKTDAEVKAWSAARIAKWNNEDDQYKATHEKPKEYKTADELNNDRMKAFQDNLGLEGLLGSAVFSALKLIPANDKLGGIINKNNFSKSNKYREDFKKKHEGEEPSYDNYDESLASEINKTRAKRVKMGVGLAAVLATSGVAGGVIGGASFGAGALGTTGGAIGAGVGLVGAGGYTMKEKAGESKFSKELEKGFAKMGKITARMAENTKAIGNLNSLLEQGKKLTVEDENGKPYPVGEFVNEDNTVNQDKIERALASLVFIAKREELKLKQLVEQRVSDKDPRMVSVRNTLMQNTITTGHLNKLKTAEKDLHNLQKENIDLGEKKSAIEKENTGTAKPKEGGKKNEGGAPKPHKESTTTATPTDHSGEGGGEKAAHGGEEKHG